MSVLRRLTGWGQLLGWFGASERMRPVADPPPVDPPTDAQMERLDAVARSAATSVDCWERSRPDLFGRPTVPTDHAALDAARRRRQARRGGSAA